MFKNYFPKRRYMLIVKMKKGFKRKNRVFRYNTGLREILYDAYWMLVWGSAESMTVRCTKNRKEILATIDSGDAWLEIWKYYFGNANWFVWYNQVQNWD